MRVVQRLIHQLIGALQFGDISFLQLADGLGEL